MTESMMLSLTDASAYLHKNLSDKKSAKQWSNYLKENPTKYLRQHGFKLTVKVVDGEIFYSETTLKAFIKLMGSSIARQEANTKLRIVDRKPKKNKFDKTPNWEFNKKNTIKNA